MSGVSNPFVASKPDAAKEAAHDIRDDLMGSTLIVQGPTAPGLSPHLEAPLKAWPTREIVPTKGIAVMALHGGAGATTITSLLGPPAMEVGHEWPLSINSWTGKAWPIPVVAVTRNDHAGIAAADHFIRSWATGQLTGSVLSALVIVDSSPRLSDGRKKATKRLLRMVPQGTHVPWIDSWLDAPPDPSLLPMRIRKIVRLLNPSSPTK